MLGKTIEKVCNISGQVGKETRIQSPNIYARISIEIILTFCMGDPRPDLFHARKTNDGASDVFSISLRGGISCLAINAFTGGNHVFLFFL